MNMRNHEILRWARDTAGLSIDEAAAKLQLKAARGASAHDRLKAFEAGDVVPTRPMLLKMSKVYRRPLVVFYLSGPPATGDRGVDFRHLPADTGQRQNALLDALLRNVRSRQRIVGDLVTEEGGEPLSYVGSASRSGGVASAVAALREILPLDLQEFRTQRGPNDAFKVLRSAVEQLGVFVILAGDLGSHHSEIKVDTFRGFTIADEMAPFIVINDRDARAAWSFTLLHELTHALLGQSGYGATDVDSPDEQFCSDVASEYLLPAAELSDDYPEHLASTSDLITWITQYADDRNLSRSMVAYRLYRQRIVPRTVWTDLTELFSAEWMEHRDRVRQASRDAESGPTYYIVKRHRIGPSLIRLVDRSIGDGSLTTTKAGLVLGVNPKNVGTLIDAGV